MAYIKLNKKNFFHNLDIICSHAKDKSKIAIVLKDNAYGHGIEQISKMAMEYGIKKAVVKDISEALQIAKFFEYILILNSSENMSYSHAFHITVNSIEDIDIIAPKSNIHIKIDTGMHRNGISIEQLEEAIHRALEQKLNITGIFTHHKSADILSSEFFWQNALFQEVKSKLIKICEKLNLTNIAIHSCNSSAFFRTSNPSDDLYRIGIAAYGYICDEKLVHISNLKPVLSLYGNKISSRYIKKGQKVGYGAKYMATEGMQVSTYDVGYGDGLKRTNQSVIPINDDNLILGRISMDNITVNSTKDEICIFDNVLTQAKLHQTIEYEILTSLNKDIKRIIC